MALRYTTGVQTRRATEGIKENNAHSNVLAAKAFHRDTSRAALGDIGNRPSQDPLGKGKKANGKKSTQASKPALSRNVANANLAVFSKRTEKLKISVPELTEDIQIDIEDIDRADFDNPQLVAEYINDIYQNMRQLEVSYRVKDKFLAGQHINDKMRTILVDWLIQVHLRFHLLQETLYLTVNIIDRFLQVEEVHRSQLQLVGVTAMLIASKYEEIYAPEVADFVYITDSAYTRNEILDMEVKILKTLGFNLGNPLCLHFLRRDSKAGNVDSQHHTMAKYFMELCLPEYDMVSYLPSEIAGASLLLAVKICNQFTWNATLQHYSGYTEEKLFPIVKKIANIVSKSATSKYQAVRTKYSSSKFMKISLSSELQPDKIAKVFDN